MTTALMERPVDTRFELNHSCTSQCPNPCPAAASELDVELAPGMLGDAA
jgi:hypothetical protein